MWADLYALSARLMFFAAIAVTTLYFLECLILDISYLSIPEAKASIFVYAVTLAYLITTLSPLACLARIANATLLGGLLYLSARFFSLGGGDVIAIPVIALMWGLPTACAIIATGCVGTATFILLRCLIRHKCIHKGDEFPVMPGISIIYLIYETITITAHYL